MKKHLIDSSITPEAASIIRASFDTILEQLAGSAQSMEDSERKHTLKIGRHHEGWCKEVMEVARQTPEIVPPSCKLAALERDFALRETVLPMLTASRQLTKILEDTFTMAGADIYNVTRAIYKNLQMFADLHGLRDTLERLSQHFAKQSREKQEPTPGPATPPAAPEE